MTADGIFDAYLGANILLACAALLWAALRLVLEYTPLRRAFATRLRLLYGLFLGLALAPLAAPLLALLERLGLGGPATAPSLADYTLAQYLDGRFSMPPSQFETLWMARTRFVEEVTTLASPLGYAVGGFLALGVAWHLIGLGRDALRVRHVIARGHVWRRYRHLTVILSDRTGIPFSVRSLRRHYIVVPTAMLSRYADLRIAVAHEMQHMREGDPGVELGLALLQPLFFWNPGFIYLRRQAAGLRELACDAEILARGRIGLAEYCGCLLRVCRDSMHRPPARAVSAPGVALIAPGSQRRAAQALRNRVGAMLAGPTCHSGRSLTIGLALSLVFAVGFLAVAAQSRGDWSQDRLMLSTIVNLERLDQRTFATRY